MTSSQIFQQFEQSSHQNYFVNLQLLEEVTKIEALFLENDIRSVRVKGISLLNRVYDDISKRNLSDIDILISENDLVKASELLSSSGYLLQPQTKWMANRHKQDFRREDNLRYSVDLHTKLIFFEKPNFLWRTVDVNGVCHLESQDHFFYLIYNWIYQDTMIGLHKFYDIYQVYSLYQATFDWARLNFLVTEFKMQKTMNICFMLLKKYFDISVPNQKLDIVCDKMTSPWLDDSFLSNPKSQPLKYFFLKHRNKSIKEAIYYDLKWLQAYWKPILSNFIQLR
jgi:hypothetical protein